MGIHFHFDRAEEIFKEIAHHVAFFKDMTYAGLNQGTSDIRVMAEPTIPALEQEADIL